MLGSFKFWGLLEGPGLQGDWSQDSQYLRNISGIHNFLSLTLTEPIIKWQFLICIIVCLLFFKKEITKLSFVRSPKNPQSH